MSRRSAAAGATVVLAAGMGFGKATKMPRAVATNDQLKALLKSHADGDDSQFYTVAMQVAAMAARDGQEAFAGDLRDLVENLRRRGGSVKKPGIVPVARPRGELAILLAASYPENLLSDLTLSATLSESIQRVLTEQRQRDLLARHGLPPARRLLFLGPPGTGKTTVAKALASELHIPLFSVRLETVITKFMGETASKLRLIFDAIGEHRGVYLFDEVDALAGDRSAGNDVAETRRILNSFLTFLEEDTSDSLLVAATNNPQLLDDAVFRRFDSIFRFPLPTPTELEEVMRIRLSNFDLSDVDWPYTVSLSMGLSQGEAVVASENAAKQAVLTGSRTIGGAELVSAIRDRKIFALGESSESKA